MAVFQTTFFSNELHRLTEMTLILPLEENKGLPPELQTKSNNPMKVVMLLHGFSGNNNDWLFNSRIQMLAMKYHMAVVCPSGENSFYVDDEHRDALYEQYLCEVLRFVQNTFPVSKAAKDTLIGGLSMGGYGAMRNGLKHPELFGNIVALSSALITDKLADEKAQKDNPIATEAYYNHVFGMPKDILGSNRDPKMLARQLTASDAVRPNIIMACGTEDFLFEANNNFSSYLKEIGLEHTYLTGPGIHDWVFWDAYIEKALDTIKF